MQHPQIPRTTRTTVDKKALESQSFVLCLCYRVTEHRAGASRPTAAVLTDSYCYEPPGWDAHLLSQLVDHHAGLLRLGLGWPGRRVLVASLGRPSAFRSCKDERTFQLCGEDEGHATRIFPSEKMDASTFRMFYGNFSTQKLPSKSPTQICASPRAEARRAAPLPSCPAGTKGCLAHGRYPTVLPALEPTCQHVLPRRGQWAPYRCTHVIIKRFF